MAGEREIDQTTIAGEERKSCGADCTAARYSPRRYCWAGCCPRLHDSATYHQPSAQSAGPPAISYRPRLIYLSVSSRSRRVANQCLGSDLINLRDSVINSISFEYNTTLYIKIWKYRIRQELIAFCIDPDIDEETGLCNDKNNMT